MPVLQRTTDPPVIGLPIGDNNMNRIITPIVLIVTLLIILHFTGLVKIF